MWTYEHISKQLLDVHLNVDTDLASRKKPTIEKTANWILETQKEKGKLNILDLDCGQGLYAEMFAEKGHSETGVDIYKRTLRRSARPSEESVLNYRKGRQAAVLATARISGI